MNPFLAVLLVGIVAYGLALLVTFALVGRSKKH